MFKSFQLADGATDAKGAEVGVYFPQVRESEKQDRRAVVVGCFPDHEDDVVLLQLVDGPSPLSPDQIAVLGRAELSEGHPFRSYGYRRLSNYEAGLADGTIQGLVEPPRDHKMQADPVQLQSSQINQGMSGAAVLDLHKQCNLVVGVISETWYPDSSTKDRDTAWAVNARVLSLEPLNLPLQDKPYPLGSARQPQTDIAAARARTHPQPGISLYGAPPPLKERWAGRVTLLQALNTEWADAGCHISELVGFGGEGKSSLARHWLDRLLQDRLEPQPDGVFWWNCYDNRSVDALFETALQYLSGGLIDSRQLSSSNVRVQVIGAMLGARRYLFILDGVEVLQHQEGDTYGLLVNTDLRELLGYFATPGHNSFCLVTSRAPLFDLISYPTFRHHDVERLSQEDGRDLLRKLGVQGPDAALDRMVTDWDGHALTLSLLGGYLVERYGGDAVHITDLPAPISNEPRYERVRRILRRYDTHLSEAERVFLLLFSAFRLPVPESALAPVFRTKGEDAASTLSTPLAVLDDTTFDALLKHLRAYHLLTYDVQTRRYTTHPLIRTYYMARLNERERSQVQAVHTRIKDYYLSFIGDPFPSPTLNDLAPLIEAVHHACYVGTYDEATDIYWRYFVKENYDDPVKPESLEKSEGFVLFHRLGAYETALALLLEFFPNGDISQEPLTSDRHKGFLMDNIGFCLENLGRLNEAILLHKRANSIAVSREEWKNASIGYRNVSDIYTQLGDFTASADAAHEALTMAERAEERGDRESEYYSLSYLAWTAHLQGDLVTAGKLFQKAMDWKAGGKVTGYMPLEQWFLYSHPGIKWAEYMRRAGKLELPRFALENSIGEGSPHENSRYHRVLGDLAADAGESENAQHHYNEALKIARNYGSRWILIEALLAQGRWAARSGESEVAHGYLDEALGYAVTGGYRLYEADIRVALAWAYRATGDTTTARAQAERALRMSDEMGYYWGQVDAKEVLVSIEG